jgi:hypothetical protein
MLRRFDLSPSPAQGPAPPLAWLVAALMGVVVPASAVLLLLGEPARAPLTSDALAAPILAVGLMGSGLIGAAAAGSLVGGVALALATGAALTMLARMVALPPLADPLAVSLAMGIASLSFAARGALFARSAGDKGWWIALFVVTGEVAILATAMALPGALPGWLLALLPAQWASAALEAGLLGAGPLAAVAALAALAGTGAATLLVARLLPRRWPYLIMFTTWLACSALVWHAPPALPARHAPQAAPDAPTSTAPSDQAHRPRAPALLCS